MNDYNDIIAVDPKSGIICDKTLDHFQYKNVYLIL